MTAAQLRKSILQMAVQGRLVPQNPADVPASVLLEQIRKGKEQLVRDGKLKKPKNESVILHGSDKIPGTQTGRLYEKFGNGGLIDITDELPFEIPESWEWVRLNFIVRLQAGKFISASEIYEQYEDGLFPCYGGNGRRGFVKKYNCCGTYPLIGRQGALCGNINLASGKFYATEHAVVTYPYSNIDINWLTEILLALNLNQYATATAQPGLAVSKIEQVFCPSHPLPNKNALQPNLRKSSPKLKNTTLLKEK